MATSHDHMYVSVLKLRKINVRSILFWMWHSGNSARCNEGIADVFLKLVEQFESFS